MHVFQTGPGDPASVGRGALNSSTTRFVDDAREVSPFAAPQYEAFGINSYLRSSAMARR